MLKLKKSKGKGFDSIVKNKMKIWHNDYTFLAY